MRDERRSHTFVEFGLLCVVPGVVRASSLWCPRAGSLSYECTA